MKYTTEENKDGATGNHIFHDRTDWQGVQEFHICTTNGIIGVNRVPTATTPFAQYWFILNRQRYCYEVEPCPSQKEIVQMAAGQFADVLKRTAMKKVLSETRKWNIAVDAEAGALIVSGVSPASALIRARRNVNKRRRAASSGK